MIPRPLSHPDARAPQTDPLPGMRFNLYLARRHGRRRYVAWAVPWSEVHTRVTRMERGAP